MNDTIVETRRLRGRPKVRSDEETRHLIAEAARDVFIANGYMSANMDDVAKSALVSKKTLYRLVPTKDALFRIAITDRTSHFVLSLNKYALAGMTLESALTRIMTEYGLLTLAQDTVALQKLILAESGRFPEIAASFHEAAVLPTQQILIECLEQRCLAGQIRLRDPFEAACMLRGMMIFEPLRAAMLGTSPPPDAEAIEALAKRSVTLFLNGCRDVVEGREFSPHGTTTVTLALKDHSPSPEDGIRPTRKASRAGRQRQSTRP